MSDRPKQLSNMSDKERASYQEPGAEEDSYTPGGLLDPEGGAISKLGKLFRGAAMVVGGSNIARMAATGEGKLARGLSALRSAERKQAIRETGRLDEIAADPARYSLEQAQKAKNYRAQAQNQVDLRDRVKKPGGEISQSPPQNYETHQFPEELEHRYGSGTKSEQPEYWKSTPQDQVGESIAYSKTGSGDVKMLQDEMRKLQEAGDYKGAQQVQREIQAARAGNTWQGKK